MEKTDKKSDILTAAEKLFSEFGYEGTSTRMIAKESGANMAMINYYFGGKEGVFLEIMESKITAHRSQIQGINDLKVSAWEKLQLVIDQYANKIFSNMCFHRMMQRELSLSQRPELYSKINDAVVQNRKVIERIIEGGIENGEFKQVDVRMLIAGVFGTISAVGLQPSKVVDNEDFDIENDVMREALRQRVAIYIKELVKSYLIIPKNDK